MLINQQNAFIILRCTLSYVASYEAASTISSNTRHSKHFDGKYLYTPTKDVHLLLYINNFHKFCQYILAIGTHRVPYIV
jgi:hypothetical protein